MPAVVKGFGCRPPMASRSASRPVSESLEEGNRGVISLRGAVRGDLWGMDVRRRRGLSGVGHGRRAVRPHLLMHDEPKASNTTRY